MIVYPILFIEICTHLAPEENSEHSFSFLNAQLLTVKFTLFKLICSIAAIPSFGVVLYDLCACLQHKLCTTNISNIFFLNNHYQTLESWHSNWIPKTMYIYRYFEIRLLKGTGETFSYNWLIVHKLNKQRNE